MVIMIAGRECPIAIARLHKRGPIGERGTLRKGIASGCARGPDVQATASVPLGLSNEQRLLGFRVL